MKPNYKLFVEQVKLGLISIDDAADLIESQAAEIEGLKRDLEVTRTRCDNYVIDNSKLKALCDQLGEALNTLWIAAPSEVQCQNMHHPKPKQHRYDETCELVSEYLEAITAASEAIRAWRAVK